MYYYCRIYTSITLRQVALSRKPPLSTHPSDCPVHALNFTAVSFVSALYVTLVKNYRLHRQAIPESVSNRKRVLEAPVCAYVCCLIGETNLLDRRRLLETVSVDTTQKLLAKVHGIEGIDALIPVRLDIVLRERFVAFVAPRSSFVPRITRTPQASGV